MKKILIYVIFNFAMFVTPYAQTPDTLWSKIHDVTNDIDIGRCVIETNNGEFIITGSCVPDGMNSFTDVLLIKTDYLGNVIWTKTFDNSFFEEGYSVEQTMEGGIIIGGTRLIGSYPPVINPVSDVWIIKTNGNGDSLWSRSIGGEGNEYCTSIKCTSDTCYIFTGASNATSCLPDWEINELVIPDTGNTMLVKMDVDGNIVWDKSYLKRSNGNYVIETSDNGYLITGCIFPDEQSNQSDVLLIKTDLNGDTLWTKNIGSEDYEVGFSVQETEDGYIVSGQIKSPGEPYDALLIKTDFNGNTIWIKNLGGELSDAALSVNVSNDGYCITGATNGIWWISNSADMWICKTDFNGNLLWEQAYDINFSDVIFSSSVCADFSYIVTGMTSSGFGGDLWLAKIGPETTDIKISNDKTKPNDYVLYQNHPNPFNSSTKIRYSVHKKSLVILTVFNAIGEEVLELMNEEKLQGIYEIDFDAGLLPGGVYFYKIDTGDFIQVKKMIYLK